jgi:phospholipid-binding lipoprotein MlaA
MKSVTSSGLIFFLIMSFSMLSVGAEKNTMMEDSKKFWKQWNKYIKLQLESPDPWESWNRKVFGFNDFVDRYTLSPAAKAYRYVTPDPVENGVGNVFSNLSEITNIINGLLQFKLVQAGSDTGRFVVNSTVGLLGVFDVATGLGLEKTREDFGQTLGYWGIGPGPYVVLPFMGPLNLRDGLGTFADSYTDLVRDVDHIPTRNKLYGLRLIDVRARLLAAEELVSGDRYTFVRDVYLQRREFLVNDGEVEDSFGEDDWEDSWNEE